MCRTARGLLVPVLLLGFLVVPARSQDQGTTAAPSSEDRNRSESNDVEQLEIPRSSDPGKQRPVRTFFADEYQMWTSPFRASQRKFIKYEIPFIALAAGMIASDRATSKVLPNTTDQTKWSKRVSQIGAPYSLAGYSLAMYLVSRATGDKRERETGFLSLEAVAHTVLMTQILKTATQRERPDATGGHGGFFSGGDSFPSGHSSGSFAAATVFAYEYHDKKWVPPVAYSLATLVAASRISGQRHYLSDVTVGAALGFLTGRYIYKSHHDPVTTGQTSRAALMPSMGMLPYVAIGPRPDQLVRARGVTLTWVH